MIARLTEEEIVLVATAAVILIVDAISIILVDSIAPTFLAGDAVVVFH
jgi:hypothetical protein